MFIEKELPNTYLSTKEFVFHGAIIGLGIGVLNMFYEWFLIITSNLPETDTTTTLLVLFSTSLLNPIVTPIFTLFSALLTYPLYSFWAKSKGGLLISLQSKEQNDASL